MQPVPMPPPAPLPHSSPQDDEVDFSRFLKRLVVDRKKPIFAALIAAALAVPFDLLRPDIYLAEVVLMATEHVSEGGDRATINDNPYRALLANRTLSQEVLNEFKLSEPPISMSVDEFIEDHLEVSAVRGSSLLVARFRSTDPNVAAGVLNSLAVRAVNLNRKLNADDANWIRDQLGEQAKQAEAEFLALERQLLEVRQSNQVDLLRGQRDVIVANRGELADLEARISALRAKLSRAEEELKARQPVVAMSRSIVGEPALAEAARESGSTLGLQMKAEEQNPVYTKVDEEIALGRTELAALEGRHKELLRAAGRGNSATVAKLYESETKESQLRQSREVARRTLDDLSLRYQRARAEAVSSGSKLKIVDVAQVPKAPLKAYRGLYIALAAGVGLVLATMYLILKEVGRAVMGLPPPTL